MGVSQGRKEPDIPRGPRSSEFSRDSEAVRNISKTNLKITFTFPRVSLAAGAATVPVVSGLVHPQMHDGEIRNKDKEYYPLFSPKNACVEVVLGICLLRLDVFLLVFLLAGAPRVMQDPLEMGLGCSHGHVHADFLGSETYVSLSPHCSPLRTRSGMLIPASSIHTETGAIPPGDAEIPRWSGDPQLRRRGTLTPSKL